MYKVIILCIILLFAGFNTKVLAQESTNTKKDDYTPFELLSSYYENDFRPFKKSNFYLGLAFSLEDKKLFNTDYLIEQVLNGGKKNFDILLKGGYYIGSYAMVGINLKYFENKFEGDIYRSPDTLQSNSISRGFYITPNIRTSVPLTANERLSFFSEVGITYGRSTSLSRDIKNVDEVEKVFSTTNNLRIGLSPGITFFAMENFAFEVQLNLLGYNLDIIDKTVNGVDESRQVRQNVDFKIDILSLELGLAYYFVAGKK